MSNSYLTKLQVDDVDIDLGNALFGVCYTYAATANKIVTLSSFDDIESGVNIHVRFPYGSSTTNGTLQVGNAPAYPIRGSCVCEPDEILSFVFELTTTETHYWTVTGHYVAPSNNLPAAVGTATIGSSKFYARADHTHAIDVSVGNAPGQITIAGQTYTIPGIGGNTYVVCNTTAGVAEKYVYIADFTYTSGTTIYVKFTYGNTVNASLNINYTGAYPLVQFGENGQEKTIWNAGAILALTFDGNCWVRDASTVSDNSSSSTGSNYVTSVNYDTNTRILSYTIDYLSTDNLLTLGTMAFANTTDYVPNSISTEAYDMLYFNGLHQPVRLPANTFPVRKFLRMTGTTASQNGTTIPIGSVPTWDTLTAYDVGLENLVNVLQVTNITYNSLTGVVEVTFGSNPPTTLFTLGSNAFNSTAYLPLTGGTLTGPLAFTSTAPTLTWDDYRIYVNNGFYLQHQQNATWNNILEITTAGIVANTFQGALVGNASSASALTALTNVNLNAVSGVVAFTGENDSISANEWIGLQLGADTIKLQIIETTTGLNIRTYTNSTWNNWTTLLTANDIVSGTTNGTIQVNGTDIAVTGLGALAYLDTIANNSITNNMLAGSITKDKLELDVVKVFNKTEVLVSGTQLNLDNIGKNGLVYCPSAPETTVLGIRPSSFAGALFNVASQDELIGMQIFGNDNIWCVRGFNGINASFGTTPWRTLVIENIAADLAPHTWNISISGQSEKALRDSAGNVITSTYATHNDLNALLATKDALVFQGLLVDVGNEGVKRISELPTYGYSAGDTYKVAFASPRNLIATDTNSPLCEPGDLVIAIHDGPLTDPQYVTSSDWTVVQSNLENPLSGPANGVTRYSFAVYDSTSGKYLTHTGPAMTALMHTAITVRENSSTGYLDGFRISGMTLSAAADLQSNAANQLRYGDAGPQIQFDDLGDMSQSTTQGAIIYNGHQGDSLMGATFNFVSYATTTALKADALVAKQRVAIGTYQVNANKALLVYGNTLLHGDFAVEGDIGNNEGTYTFSIACNNGRFIFDTVSNPVNAAVGQFQFNNSMYIRGDIIPLENTKTLGYYDSVNNTINSWRAVFIGPSASIGSATHPIYWSNGVPTPVTYTPNLIYAPITMGGQTDFTATPHFIDNESIGIGYNDKQTGYALAVNGNAIINGNLNLNSNIAPSINQNNDLGTSTHRWRALYIGDNQDGNYGDAYTPIYWNQGVPAVAGIIQKKNFTFAAGDRTIQLSHAAFGENTLVLAVVVTSGKEHLPSPISWGVTARNITLRLDSLARGEINGYILTARGIDLDQVQEVTQS